jgi:hypothetical protein
MPLSGSKIGLLYGSIGAVKKGIPRMRLSHAVPVRSAVFDQPNLVSHAGLVPAMGLAARADLAELAERHVTVPGGAGHAAGLKVSALVGGMVAGADSISDMAVLRHGAMGRLFTGVRAPSTLGHVPAGFPVRACPAVGRGRDQVPDRPDPTRSTDSIGL